MTADTFVRPLTEAPELGAAMQRMVAAMVRRATNGDLFALEELQTLVRVSHDALAQAARGAHDGPASYSWNEIARGLGISRQAARQLYGASTLER